MWRCDQCDAEAEDHFEVCWSCGTPRAGLAPEEEIPEGAEEHGAAGTRAPEVSPDPDEASDAKRCVACAGELAYRGEIPLRTGGPDGWTLFHGLEQYGERLWPVQVWACTACRRLALYEGEGAD